MAIPAEVRTFLDGGEFSSRQLLFDRGETARHSQTMIPVTEIPVGIGQKILSCNNTVSDEEHHLLHLLDGKVVFCLIHYLFKVP